MTASSSGSLSDRNYDIFEKIAVDYKDCSVRSKRGYNGIMLYSDRKSDYIYPILVKNKKNVIDQLEQLQNIVKNNNKTWRILQGDSESIFSKAPVKKWCQNNNVEIEIFSEDELNRQYPIDNDILWEDDLFDDDQQNDFRD